MMADKLKAIPEDALDRLETLKNEARSKGIDLIDIAAGNPDMPTPPHIVEELCRASKEGLWTHMFTENSMGLPEFRQAVAAWYRNGYGVELDPETEILPLIGSKEGIANLYFSCLREGDYVLATEPSYLVHRLTPLLSGARLHAMPLNDENGYIPELGKVPGRVLEKTRILSLNYPNNPTGATLDDTGFFREAISFAKKRDIMLIHDFHYSEITFDGFRSPSFLQTPGAKTAGVEFHSLTKTYSMGGCRVGFVAGNAAIIKILARFKSLVDYGVPGFIQRAAVAALSGPQNCVKELAFTYQKRRDALCCALASEGWPVRPPRASLYVWTKLPSRVKNMTSMEFVKRLMLEAGVAIRPGSGFGAAGEGYVRMALTESEEKMREAGLRIGGFLRNNAVKTPVCQNRQTTDVSS